MSKKLRKDSIYIHEMPSLKVNLLVVYEVYASACAGSFTFGSVSRSWIPRRTWTDSQILESKFILACLIVMAGRQSFSSSKIDKQTVPEG